MGTIPPDVRLALESLKRNPHTVVLVEDPTAGPDLSYVDDSQADFEQGTMDGVRVDMRPGLVRLRCFGACLGPVNKGDRYLGARVWMVTKEGDKVIVRQANETNDAWALEEEAEGMSVEEQAAADLPDIYFDKQGQYVIAYEKTGAGGPEVWVSRVTTDPETGQRLVVQEKVADGREPKLIRDLDNDMVVFYRDVTDPQNTLIKYRIQSEGWATEREVPIGIVGEKWVEDVVVLTTYQLMLLFTIRDTEGYHPYALFTKARIQAAFDDVLTEFENPAIEITSMNWIPNQHVEMTGTFTSPEVGILNLTLIEAWNGTVTDTFRICDVSITRLTLIENLIHAQTEASFIPTCSIIGMTWFGNTNYTYYEALFTPGVTIQNIALTSV